MEHFQLLGIFLSPFSHTQIGVEPERDSGGTQLFDKEQAQGAIGHHFLDAVLTQCFGCRLCGGCFSIAIQTTFGCEVGWTGNSIGVRLGSSPVHFNIAHDQQPAFRELQTRGGIADGESNAVVQRVVVGGNSSDQRGGGHDWSSLTVTSLMPQGLGTGSTIG